MELSGNDHTVSGLSLLARTMDAAVQVIRHRHRSKRETNATPKGELRAKLISKRAESMNYESNHSVH